MAALFPFCVIGAPFSSPLSPLQVANIVFLLQLFAFTIKLLQ
jgi:hypothetical protein